MSRPGRARIASAAVVLALLSAGCVPPPPSEPIAAVTGGEDRARAATVRIRAVGPCAGVGVGTGFVIDGGRIVTNRHVVDGASRFEVETWQGDPVGVKGAYHSTATDVALLDLRPRAARRFEPLVLADRSPRVDEEARALGYAEAGPAVLTRGRLVGTPAGSDYLDEPGRVLRMTTEVKPGNSGGPVLNEDFEVAGVVYALQQTEDGDRFALGIPLARLHRVLAAPMVPVAPDC